MGFALTLTEMYLPTCFMAKTTAPSASEPSVRKIVVKFSLESDLNSQAVDL